MNTAEIDTFTGRLALFTDRGLCMADAEVLADKLVKRDREQDDRRLCLECAHLRGAGRWRCGSGVAAELAIRGGSVELPGEMVQLLQRCTGFGWDTGGRVKSLECNAAGNRAPSHAETISPF